MSIPCDKESLTETLSRRSNKLRTDLADSISAIHLDFLEVCDDCSVLFSLTPAAWMRNPGGVMHGGIICTLMDVGMGIVVSSYKGHMCPTVDMHVEFIRPVRLDTPVIIRAETSSIGKTLAYMRAKLWQGDESQPCATGTAIYYAK